MNKISQKKVRVRSFQYMKGRDSRQYEVLMSIEKPIEKLSFISKETPTAACFMDEEGKVYWRPKLGQVLVSTSTEFKKYPTATGAYREAMRIKGLMSEEIETLKQAYKNNFLNQRIINKHYLSIEY